MTIRPGFNNSMLIRLWFLLVAAFAAGLASAHPAPFSYLDLKLDATKVQGVLVIHDFDAAHELELDKPERLLDAEVARRFSGELTRIVESRLRIDVGSRAAKPVWGGIQVLADRQSLLLTFELGASAGRLDIDTVLFPYDRNHQTFVNVYEGGVLKHQAILNADRHTLNYYSSGAQGHWAVVQDFAQAGIHHIFIGVDHILFLLGLLLLGGSLWRLATIVTAFTLGHTLTLSLAVLGVVRIASSIVEPAIALSIVVVGVDNLLVRKQRLAGNPTARDLRPWLAGVFGLIHGFGFAAVLVELGLPADALGWSLAAFNLGVEIGQLVIVLAAALGLLALRRYNNVLAERLSLFGSLLVIAAGGYWFVQRIGVV